MRFFLALLVVPLAAAAQTTPAPGPTLEDVMHARNYAMGGAFRALGYGAESVIGNPAALSIYRRYQLEISGAYDFKQSWGYGSVSVADSVTNQLAAGLSYQLVSIGKLENQRTAHLTTMASSLPVADWLHVGLAVRHQVITGALSNTNSVTMAAGIILRPFELLCLSFSGHNLIGVWNPDVPRYFSFAASSLIGGQFTPTFELRADLNQAGPRFVYAGGLEWLFSNTFPLRVGYAWDGVTSSQYFGGGLGFFSEGSGIDLAYRHEFGGGEGRVLALTVKLQFN